MFRTEIVEKILDLQASAMDLGFDWPDQDMNEVPLWLLVKFYAEVRDFLDESAEVSYNNRLEDMNG